MVWKVEEVVHSKKKKIAIVVLAVDDVVVVVAVDDDMEVAALHYLKIEVVDAAAVNAVDDAALAEAVAKEAVVE